MSALKWENINLMCGLIEINKTLQRIYLNGETKLIEDRCKTDSSIRSIPINNTLLKLIKTLMKIVNPEYYIISNSIYPIEPRTYRVYFKKLLETFELPVIKFHATRHNFATRLIEAKANIKTISAILGHFNVATTLNLYIHPTTEQKKISIEKAFKYINKN